MKELIIVKKDFHLTVEQVGAKGKDGLSAFEIAKKNGFVGDEQEWLDSLRGEDGIGFDGVNGDDGLDGIDGEDGTTYVLNSLFNKNIYVVDNISFVKNVQENDVYIVKDINSIAILDNNSITIQDSFNFIDDDDRILIARTFDNVSDYFIDIEDLILYKNEDGVLVLDFEIKKSVVVTKTYVDNKLNEIKEFFQKIDDDLSEILGV